MNLGKAIKLCRTQKNLKQADLAEKASLSVSYLSLIESGKRDPSFSTIENIALALEIPLSILIFLAGENKEFEEISPELSERLSLAALKLMRLDVKSGSPI